MSVVFSVIIYIIRMPENELDEAVAVVVSMLFFAKRHRIK